MRAILYIKQNNLFRANKLPPQTLKNIYPFIIDSNKKMNI